MAEVAFWSAAALLFYGYAGYPLVVVLASRILDRRVEKAPVTPSVSLLIAAYNEEDVIGERLTNALASAYPEDALEVVVASDGSTDRTEEIVRSFESDQVRLLSLPRRGKMSALTEAARCASGEILVFSDANTEFEPDAIGNLVRSFHDPNVGGVVGHTSYRMSRPTTEGAGEDDGWVESAGRGEDLYWRYDTWLKKLESRTGSVVSAHGGMYAVRRDLFRPPDDAAVTDDFAISTAVVEQGKRLVFEPDARGYEEPMRKSEGEFRRRVRLMTRGLRGVLLRRTLLDPSRHGFYSVALFSRKVLRRLLPFALPILILASSMLWNRGALYAGATMAQAGFYALALAGWTLRRSTLGRFKPFYVPFFYCLANLASVIAVANLLRGRRIERWVPQRQEAEDDADPEAPRDTTGQESNASDAPTTPRFRADVDDEDTPAAIVIGMDCATGLQTARILAARGIPVLGTAADTRHPCARTRVCQEIVESDPGDQGFVAVLQRLAERRSTPAVLFPCTDLAVLRLARDRRDLPGSLEIVLPEVNVINDLLDKGRFQVMARERGFPIPETRLLMSREEALDASWSMRFPCVVKPPVKTALWESRTSAKVFKAPDGASLIALFDRFSDVTDGLVVQEWIEGPATSHFTCNCYIGRDGRPKVSLTTRKLRQWPPVGGQASLSEECRDERVRRETLRVFGEVGLRGFGYLEMKWDEKRKKHLILEANVGRPTGRSATAEAAGVEYLLTAYRDALGLPLPEARIQRFRNVKWIRVRHDLQAAADLIRKGELGPREWLRSIRGPRAYALFSWRDPVPFLADTVRAAGKLLARLHDRSTPSDRGSASDADRAPARGDDPGGVASSGTSGTSTTVDFQTSAGVVVRLVSPSPNDVRAVEEIIGPSDRPNRGAPDILIRYEDTLDAPDLRLIQGGRSGYTDDGFFLLRSRSRKIAARIRMGDDEPWTELTCPRDGSGVPLLRPLLDLHSLERGWTPLHASAWIHREVGIVAAGWDRSGKTGALLAFADRGAAFVGDDRVLVHRGGKHMAGYRRPITIKDWHLAQLTGLARQAGIVRRSLSGVGARLGSLQARTTGGRQANGLASRALHRAIGGVRRRLEMKIDPDEAVGRGRCPGRGAPDLFFLLLSHADPQVRVIPMDPQDVAGRLAAAVQAELEPLVEANLAYRFARPGSRWTLLDRAHELALEQLEEALAGTPAYAVHHPYTGPLDDLYAAMDPVIAAAGWDGRRLTRSTPTELSPTQPRFVSTIDPDDPARSFRAGSQRSPGPADRTSGNGSQAQDR